MNTSLNRKVASMPSEESQPQAVGPEKNVVIDISESYGHEAFSLLKETGEFVYKKKRTDVTPLDLLHILVTKPEVIAIIERDKLEIPETDVVASASEIKKFNGTIYFSPETMKVLFGAYFSSKQENAPYVTPVHLFNALGPLHEIGTTFAGTKKELSGASSDFALPETLSKFAKEIVYNLEAGSDTFVGRENELEHILRILVRENSSNTLLIGEHGVGKSSLAEGFAKLLKVRNIPSLLGTRVIVFDVGLLFSTQETAMTNAPKIIEELSLLPRSLFFLEQVDMLQDPRQLAMLVSLLQAMAGSSQVSFAIPLTASFYSQFIASNPYFSSSYEVIKIEEMDVENTTKVLEKHSADMEKFQKVNINKEIFDETASLSKRYIPGNLPQKALSILEEACASAFLAKKSTVELDDVRNIISQKTGIPISSLSTSEKEKLSKLETILGQYVIGQEYALHRISEALRRARAGLKDPKKPIGSFLFLGSSGVGKTELAKTLSSVFFDNEKAFIRLDMSEYKETQSIQRLIGSPPGFVGYEEGGQLTNPVLERPYCLILLDEIEKAHPSVFDVFLQVLDDGRLTDSQGRLVDFKNTLLIFTSNIASGEFLELGDRFMDPDFDRKAFFDEVVMPQIRLHFRPEFVNRFDDIIVFNPLNKEVLKIIAKNKIKNISDRLEEKKIKIEVSEETLSRMVDESYNPAFGARLLERTIRDQVENISANKIISGEVKEGETIRL